MFKEKSSVALLSVFSNTILVILKVAVGILTNSVSVLAEALHSGFDLMAAVIAYFSVRGAGLIAYKSYNYMFDNRFLISATIRRMSILTALSNRSLYHLRAATIGVY